MTRWIVASVLTLVAQIAIPKIRWFKPRINTQDFTINVIPHSDKFATIYVRCPVKGCSARRIQLIGDTPVWRVEEKISSHIRRYHG